MPILPADRDPRLITVRRGGTLTDENHRLLPEWATRCAEHVLHLIEQAQPNDTRPRDAIDICRAWVRGEVRMRDAHRAAFPANAAGRDLPEPAKYAALAAGRASPNETGSERESPPKYGSSSSTTSDVEARSAGTSSTTDTANPFDPP